MRRGGGGLRHTRHGSLSFGKVHLFGAATRDGMLEFSWGGGGMLHGSQERRVAGNGSGTPVDRAALARWRHMAQESHHGAGINTSHVPTSFLSRCQPFHSS